MSALRPPTEDDAPEVARLMSAHAPERVDAAEVANEWAWPTVDVRSDARIGEGAYVLVGDIGEARGWIDVQGLPATEALDWAEGRLREKGGRRAFTGGWSTNERLPGALETRGYRRTRSSWRMEVPLGAAPPGRRRGIGHALLARALGAFPGRGLARAGLGVDSENPTGANALYEDVGMASTSRFDIYERILA